MDGGVWDRVAGFFLLLALLCVVHANCQSLMGGSWDKQIEELIYARGLLPRAPVASVTGSGGKFLHSPAPAQCNRAGRGCTEGTFEEHICSCSAGEEGLSTATARLRAHQSGNPGASEGQDGPNPAACLEISIHLTTVPDTPPPIPV